MRRGEIVGVGGLAHCGMHTLGKVCFGAVKPEDLLFRFCYIVILVCFVDPIPAKAGTAFREQRTASGALPYAMARKKLSLIHL